MNRLTLAAAGLAVTASALALSTPAQAAEKPIIVNAAENDRPVIYVGYADLNLLSTAGIAALNGRIERAATSLCIDEGVRSLQRMMEGQMCRRTAIESASGQLRLALARFGAPQYASLSRIAVTRR